MDKLPSFILGYNFDFPIGIAMLRRLITCLRIVDLEILCIVGILPEERATPQRLLLNAELDVDFDDAVAEGTSLTRGVDYGAVAHFLQKKIEQEQYGLLEELLVDCTQAVFEKFPDLWGMHLRATKPDILKNCRGVEAEIKVTRRPEA